MNVVVLGGASPAGARLVAMLREAGWARPVPVRPDDPAAARALREADAVVDCSPDTQAPGARAADWMQACIATPGVRLVVLGSAQVYGATPGRIDERTPLHGRATGTARAWRAAEEASRACAAACARVVVLRAGPLWGVAHPSVREIVQLLRNRRLGDLGPHGDGWSNLLPVDDACLAVIRALQLPLAAGEWRPYNLAAPDSPRWNEVFVELALAVGATPVPRIAPWRVAAERCLAGPLRLPAGWLDASAWPPGHGAWRLQQRLDASAAAIDLRLDWTPHAAVLAEAAAWEARQDSLARLCIPPLPRRRKAAARPGT